MIEHFDSLDRKILRALQDDGRITNQELAERCSLSPSACLERTRRLKERGVITGFSAQLNPSLLDQSLVVFIEVRLERNGHGGLSSFAQAAAEEPQILECHLIAGGFDYLLKVRVADMDHYHCFLAECLSRLPEVKEMRSYAVLDEIKCTTRLNV